MVVSALVYPHDGGADWELRLTAATQHHRGSYCVSLAWKKIKIQISRYCFYWMCITSAPSKRQKIESQTIISHELSVLTFFPNFKNLIPGDLKLSGKKEKLVLTKGLETSDFSINSRSKKELAELSMRTSFAKGRVSFFYIRRYDLVRIFKFCKMWNTKYPMYCVCTLIKSFCFGTRFSFRTFKAGSTLNWSWDLESTLFCRAQLLLGCA